MKSCAEGHQNPDRAKFCGTCGRSMSALGEDNVTTVPPLPIDFMSRFKSELGQLQRDGYSVSLQSTLAMVSGALFAVAVALTALYNAGESSSSFTAGLWWSLAGISFVYLVGRTLSKELISGATTAFLPLSVIAALFLFRPQVEEGKLASSLLTIGIITLAAWLMPILRGRPALLATSLLSVGSGLLVLIAQNSVADSLSCSYDVTCLDDPQAVLAENVRNASITQLVLGIALLGIAWALDRRGWNHLGRTFIGVGTVFEIGGAWAVFGSSSDKTAGAILLTIAAALLVGVAVRETRKASLVIGGIGMILGLVVLIAALTEKNETPVAFIILALATSCAVAVVAAKKSDAVEAILNRQA